MNALLLYEKELDKRIEAEVKRQEKQAAEKSNLEKQESSFFQFHEARNKMRKNGNEPGRMISNYPEFVRTDEARDMLEYKARGHRIPSSTIEGIMERNFRVPVNSNIIESRIRRCRFICR